MSRRSRRSTSRPASHSGDAAAKAVASTTGSGSSSAARRRQRRDAARRRSRRWAMPALLGVAGLAAAAVIAGGMVASSASSQLPATRAVLGSADAAVVIREYGDFQCPSCGAFARQIEPQIRAAYVDTEIVRLEWHDFAWIGRESRDAANAARCAGDQGKFWEYHDVLYRSQAGENRGAFSKERLKDMGERLDIEPVAFAACVDGDSHADAVQRDMADVRERGFNATPTFLVGDQRIVGAQPFEVFQAAIEAQLGGG